jgi:hypothetical protein
MGIKTAIFGGLLVKVNSSETGGRTHPSGYEPRVQPLTPYRNILFGRF